MSAPAVAPNRSRARGAQVAQRVEAKPASPRGPLDLATGAQSALLRVGRELPCSTQAVLIALEHEPALQLVAHTGEQLSEECVASLAIRAEECARAGRLQRVSDADPLGAGTSGAPSFLIAPLPLRDGARGVLLLADSIRGFFVERDDTRAAELARQLAFAVAPALEWHALSRRCVELERELAIQTGREQELCQREREQLNLAALRELGRSLIGHVVDPVASLRSSANRLIEALAELESLPCDSGRRDELRSLGEEVSSSARKLDEATDALREFSADECGAARPIELLELSRLAIGIARPRFEGSVAVELAATAPARVIAPRLAVAQLMVDALCCMAREVADSGSALRVEIQRRSRRAARQAGGEREAEVEKLAWEVWADGWADRADAAEKPARELALAWSALAEQAEQLGVALRVDRSPAWLRVGFALPAA